MIRKLLWAVLVINVVYVTLGVAKYGSQHIDAYGIWMLKAKSWSVLWDERYSYSHQQYPLLLPVMMTGFTRLTGSLEAFLWIYPLIYTSILLILYKLLRLEGQEKTAALASTVVASFMGPLMAQGGRMHAGLADIWIALLVGLGMIAMRRRKPGWLVVIVVLASQIKMEGIFLLALFLGMRLGWKKKIGWMGLAVMPFVWWQGQVRAWGLPSDIGFYWPGLAELGRRVGVIGKLVIQEMLNWRNWYIIWPIWWLGSGRKTGKLLGWVSLGYLGVYLFSVLDPGQYVSSSVDRIMLQWLPLWWPMLGWKNEPNRNQPATVAGET